MINKIIVTCVYSNQEFDMELPANTELEQIKPAIAEALSQKGIYLSAPFRLVSNGHPLKETDTLFRSGVWDGSYLDVIPNAG